MYENITLEEELELFCSKHDDCSYCEFAYLTNYKQCLNAYQLNYKRSFYTIMEGTKFINSNFMRDKGENIDEAIRFGNVEEAIEYYDDLRKDKEFKIVKVNCTLEDVPKNIIYNSMKRRNNYEENKINEIR